MDRDPRLERYLLDIAAQSAGYSTTSPTDPFAVAGDDGGLGAFADARIGPGPVVLPRDFDQEVREELADAANYSRWAIQEHYAAFLAGDPQAAIVYERHMRVLCALVRAWRELRTRSS